MVIAAVVLALLAGCGSQASMDPDGGKSASRTASSCYQYIVDRMMEPQYWSFPLEYATEDDRQQAAASLINGTGWRLTDEETATFTRGYQGLVALCFQNRQAVGYQSDGSQSDGIHYDLSADQPTRFRLIDGLRADMMTDDAWLQGSGYETLRQYMALDDLRVLSVTDELSRTLAGYEKEFAAHGCPLAGKPTGTLTAYRRQLAHEAVFEIGQKTIAAPWQQEAIGLLDDTDLGRLDDLDAAWYPTGSWRSGRTMPLIRMDGSRGLIFPDNYYDVVFVRSSWAGRPVSDQAADPYEGARFEQLFVDQACRFRRGQGCVRLADADRFPTLWQTSGVTVAAVRDRAGYDRRSFSAGRTGYDASVTMTFMYGSDDVQLMAVTLSDWHHGDIYLRFAQIYDEFSLQGLTMPFSKDYACMFVLWTDKQFQRQLGLR